MNDTLSFHVPHTRHGRFVGRVVTEWMDSAAREDRRMRLHADTSLAFQRPNGEWITSDIGLEFDGASIPVWAWVLVGSPFTGKYRKAAVIHDTLCARRDRPWPEVHQIFYEAMRARGMGWVRARLMYVAIMVRALFPGGMRWEDPRR